jgi:hypothetical protein
VLRALALAPAAAGAMLIAARTGASDDVPPRAGDHVQWITFEPQKSEKDKDWGEFLTDLENHLPKEYGKKYRDKDRVGHAHETTHGIQAHIRNQYAEPGLRLNAFYVGEDYAALVEEPKVRLAQVAALVPERLRKVRYKSYLVKQQKDWDDEPLYVFDEWVAYCNGAKAGIELAEDGKYKPERNDSVWALLEFNVYAVYTVRAARKHDPGYDGRQLDEFLAWNLRRSMYLYRIGSRLDPFNWDDDEYYRFLRTDRSATEMRRFLRDLYGAAWCRRVMGW